MTERVMNIDAVPSYLTATLHSGKVKVRESGGEIRIVPITENATTDRFLAIKHAAILAEDKMRRLYALCGSGADLEMTVDSFLVMTHDEAELSNE
ncbi:MAG: hypothetical protein LBK23_05290 [Oscillospiraceae bacterium]|nr:hypothetical protein [Oscillospiraceae bacterium]